MTDQRKIYYFDKLTKQEIADIPLRKQFRLMVEVLLNKINDKKVKRYTFQNQSSQVSLLHRTSASKLLELKLITSETITEPELTNKQITTIDRALLKYFIISKENNPIFKFFDFENEYQNTQHTKNYLKYEKTDAAENENTVRDILYKLLIEESEKKCKADGDEELKNSNK